VARLAKLEGKIDYATLKIRGKTEEDKATVHTIPAHMVWQHQDYFVSAKSLVKVPGIPDIRCFFLQSSLRSIADVEGDVAECGVREGKSALFMLHALNAERSFFLFDSFEGLSDPVSGKDTIASAIDATSGKRVFAGDVEKVRNTFQAWPNVQILPGWIPDRFLEVKARNFALVHIDVDLYQPTLDSLEFFYPRLKRHGMIVCDDYGSGAYPGARKAMDEFFADKSEKPIELPQGQAFVVKR
jgi:hypothetical protein